MVSVITLLVTTGLSFQAPSTVQVSSSSVLAQNPPLTPELRGDIMIARKMYREAIDFYKTGANSSPVLANKTGIAYHQLADLDNAKKYYQLAIKLKPTYAEAINNLGTVYYAQKSFRRAISQYRKALAMTPNSASFLSNLGTALLARNQMEEALKAYAQAVAIDPEILEQRGTQGVIVQDRSFDERSKFYYTMAKTYAKLGMADRALQNIRRALEEGFKEREKFNKDPEFAFLQDNPEFKEILAAEHKAL